MRSLSKNREQLIFDYCFGLTSEERTAQVEALIACNERAADIHARIQAALGPLESLQPEPCPEELAERTIRRLIEAKLACPGQEKLHTLLEKEQTWFPTMKFSFRGNFGDVVAAAAVVMLLAAVLVPSLGYARQKYWQQRCQVQLGSIFQGLSSYVSDHNGRLPAVGRKAGDPWWKAGCPSGENHSDTRPAWLLVKNEYVGPEKFVCPAARQMDKPQFGTLQVQNHDDFPGRACMGFSFHVCSPKAESSALHEREVFMGIAHALE